MQLIRGAVPRAFVVLGPWSWFLLRDSWVGMELVAVLLPLFVAVAIALFLALADRHHWLRLAALSLIMFGVVAVVGPWVPHDTGHPADGSVTVAVANTLTTNTRPDDVVADIVAQHANVVVVPEASVAVHQRLVREFKYSLRADTPYPSAIGVYSNIPIHAPTFVPGLLDQRSQIRVEVDGRFVLWAVHLPKPWLVAHDEYELRPGAHARKIDAFLEAFSKETMPLVVAGDINLTDRGRGYRKLTDRFDDALRGRWGGPTARKWYLRPLLLRIDHVFEPKGWCADQGGRFALTGSDHRGVRVRVGPCAS